MRTRRAIPIILTVAVLLIPILALRGCSRSHLPAPPATYAYESRKGKPMSFVLTSTAFSNGSAIPRRYTCDEADLSPALAWTGAPAETRSLALIADDPDAPRGTWTHWLLWNIPARATLLLEDTPKTELLDNGARQGLNDFQRIGYGGPCPPPGKPHRYFFKLYALDARLNLKPGAARAELDLAIEPHILAQAHWLGTYQR